MRSESDLLEYIGQRINDLLQESEQEKSRLKREKIGAIIQEYKELLEYYQSN